MTSVTFVDHSEDVHEKLLKILENGFREGARSLAEGYHTGLQREFSPEHSQPGQIPHAYAGWIEGGYGPTNPPSLSLVNNTPATGFARKQGRFTDFLSDYIRGEASSLFGSVSGSVGFLPSHVDSREKNYLIQWDQGTVPEFPGVRRPWVMELYHEKRQKMINDMLAGFRQEVTT